MTRPTLTTHRVVYTGPDASLVADALRVDGHRCAVVGDAPPMVVASTPPSDALAALALADRVGSGWRLARDVAADTTAAPVRFEVCA